VAGNAGIGEDAVEAQPRHYTFCRDFLSGLEFFVGQIRGCLRTATSAHQSRAVLLYVFSVLLPHAGGDAAERQLRRGQQPAAGVRVGAASLLKIKKG